VSLGMASTHVPSGSYWQGVTYRTNVALLEKISVKKIKQTTMPQYQHPQKPLPESRQGNSVPVQAPDFSNQPEELKGWLNSGLENQAQTKTPTQSFSRQ